MRAFSPRRQNRPSIGVSQRCRPLWHRNGCSGKRRGATIVETAITLPIFLILLLGMVELGIAVFRQHVVSQAARQATRRAIIHGKMAIPAVGKWGPATFEGPADFDGDNDEGSPASAIAASIRPYLTGLNKTQTMIRVEWLDGSNDVHSRVRARITTPHQPFITFLFGSSAWTLTGASTMPIAH